jgi:phosphoglycolate phosphatase
MQAYSRDRRKPMQEGHIGVSDGVTGSVTLRPPVAGILFDKDGTLIDFRATWVPAYFGAARELAAASPSAVGPDDLLRRVGFEPSTGAFSDDSVLLWATNAQIAERWGREPELYGLDVLAVIERHFNDLDRYPPRAVGDVAALFMRLREAGLRLGLATMDSAAQAVATADLLGVRHLLDVLIGADSGYGLKPEPGMVLAFCDAVGLEPAAVVMVGDTPADLEMGRRAGCGLVVAVLTGATPTHLLAPLADHVLADITELEPLLLDGMEKLGRIAHS